VITARRTRLLRAPDLHAFRTAIAALAPGAVTVVPTRAAARVLHGCSDASSFVTRDELYDLLHARLPAAPRLLTAVERDVLAQAAARQAVTEQEAAFSLRPGLVAEILRFYDQIRRHRQSIDRFEALIEDALGSEELDRGAARMRLQTRVLAAAFRMYERRARESGGCDEHLLRERLLAEAAAEPVQRVVVTVGDWIADPNGLYVADFDLLARLPGVLELDIVATDRILASGFDERLHDWLPGIDDAPATISTEAAKQPTLVVPEASPDRLWWTRRDREEELVSVARQLKADRRRADSVPLDRAAVVYRHPLPYLYLAEEVFGAAGVPYQTADALPLAAEPSAAAIDLVLDAAESDFARPALVALLRSPHFAFVDEGRPVDRTTVSSLDRTLSEARYLGGIERLEALTDESPSGSAVCAALRAALGAARELEPLAAADAASTQVDRVIAFAAAHAREMAEDDPRAAHERRARAAVQEALASLASAHAAHDNPSWTIRETALAIRRAIESHTFDLELGRRGVQLLDDRAARYAELSDITVVGLVEADWPERPRRNIFYPPALLNSLGWPPEKDRRAAADAHFLDLLESASRRVRLSTFTLDDDALVSPSLQLDVVRRARLSTTTSAGEENARVFADEALSLDPIALPAIGSAERRWVELRIARSPADAPQFHGTVAVGRSTPRKPWSVSAIETYLGCPFKFFAQHVLRLEEEPDDEEVMDPKHEGQLVHDVFQSFFKAWQDSGHSAITPANLDEARAMFEAAVDRELAGSNLSDAEAGLTRTRLMGSPAAAGLGEAVIRMEAERPTPVVARLLEHELGGEFTFETDGGMRTLRLRGKADRLDLLADGTFRLIDYKLGWPPDKSRALQLPVYGLCAEQALDQLGRRWTLGEAAYIAFKGPKRVVPLYRSGAERADVLARAQQRLVDTIDAIEAGVFPPTPDDVYRCESCQMAAVCRRDYVGDV
jgi:RecB family exonuclease